MSASPSLQSAPFADDFVDVTELNASVSGHVLARIDAVRSAVRRGERVGTSAAVVLGPAGGGKTHLVGRIRQSAGAQATLVLLRPYFGVGLSLRDVLATTIDHLCRRPKGGTLSQLAVIVSYWLAPEEGALFPTTAALETHALAPEARAVRIETAVARVLEHVPELAPVAHLVRALLAVGSLDGSARWAELAWLSGREPRMATDETAEQGSPLPEGDVLHLLPIGATLAAPVAPVLLVLDQLENLALEGEERVLAYGNLVSELVDSVPCLSIVQLALTSEWIQFIEPRLSLAQRSRIANEKLVLELPSEKQQRGLLLRAWQDRMQSPASGPGRKRRLGHPLTEDQVRELLTAPGVTPRLLATAFGRALAGKTLRRRASRRITPEPCGTRGHRRSRTRSGSGGAGREGGSEPSDRSRRARRGGRRSAVPRSTARSRDAERARTDHDARPRPRLRARHPLRDLVAPLLRRRGPRTRRRARARDEGRRPARAALRFPLLLGEGRGAPLRVRADAECAMAVAPP